MNKIVLIAQSGNKIGYGHLKRLKNFAEILKNNFEISIINFSKKNSDDILNFIKKNNFSFAILDFRYYKEKLVKDLLKRIPLVLIDSHKIFNSNFPTLYINILNPLKFKYLKNNQFVYDSINLIPIKIPKNLFFKKRTQNCDLIITFGNSDPNKLTLRVLRKIKKLENIPSLKIIIGKYFNENYKIELKNYIKNNFSSNYEIVEAPENLLEHIIGCRYLITSFGLTFIEGLIFKKIVGLYNNSFYHKKLASNFKGSFIDLGFFPFPVRDIKNLFSEKNLRLKIIKPDNKSLLRIIKNFSKANNSLNIYNCKICGKPVRIVLNQFGKRIYECKSCKVKFLELENRLKPEIIYNEDYFTEEYRKQYGKTYIEDRENILKLAEARLNVIKKILKGRGGKILDIGCAYGFFLLKALEFGFDPTGIEIEKKASNYAKKNLKINVINGDFLKLKIKEKFDIITLWYVLEHFEEPFKFFDKIDKIINKAGLVAIAVPNGNGAFYKFKRREYFNSRSDHHYFDWTIKSLKILFKKFGFKLKKVRITGIHPERLGIENKFFQKIVGIFLKIFNLGDTMELYFIKK